MVSVLDVAKAFLHMETMTHKKLQKLCYYAQAWHLALFDGEPLVNTRFEAWIHGPVSPELYSEYKQFGWNPIPMESQYPTNINSNKIEFLENVYESYGQLSGDQLEMLSHMEDPWLKTRGDLPEWQACDRCIEEELMKVYYQNEFEKRQND